MVGRRETLLLIALFWTFAFALSSIRGIVVGEIPFPLLAPHRLAVMLFGALLCWLMTYVLDPFRSRRFADKVVLGLASAALMTAIQSAFHMLSCRIAPIEGFAPITIRETLNSGLITFGYFVAWTWMHLALVYHREQEAERVQVVARAPEAPKAEEAPAMESFWASRRREFVRVRGEDILWVEAQKDYVQLHARGGGGMLRETLGSVEAKLDPHLFVRVHRSAIVRKTEIKAIRRRSTGAVALTLSTGEEVPVGRSYARGLRDLLDQMRGG